MIDMPSIICSYGSTTSAAPPVDVFPAYCYGRSPLAKIPLVLNTLNFKPNRLIARASLDKNNTPPLKTSPILTPETSSSDEPLTPADCLFARQEMNTIIHCSLGFERRMDIDTLKTFIKKSPLIHHPRFCSLLVRDKSGILYWRRTEINIDRHILLVNTAASASNCRGNLNHDFEQIINEYIADLSVSNPLSFEKPLWEIHLLVKEKCAVFRIHHAVGDGMSLMSMLLAICSKADDRETMATPVSSGRRNWKGMNGNDWTGKFIVGLKKIWFSFTFCTEFVLRFLVSDMKTVISGGEGIELWPRKVTTAKFKIEDMKLVKKTVANATINDVLLGVVSAGLSRYLDHRSPNSMQEGQRLTGVTMVNLREQPGLLDWTEMMRSNSKSAWGNKFGIMLVPVYYYNKLQPLQYVERVKKMMDRKKQSLEAQFSYELANLLMSLFESKVPYVLSYRLLCGTTFSISNMVGPKEEITIEDNPITFVRVCTSSLPQAVVMHMVSYAGRADMQIVVPKGIIPDPEFLAKCFEDSLLEMKQVALATLQV